MKKLVLILLIFFSIFVPAFSQDDCLIKGNINSKGDKIYHVPGSASYASTKIDTAKGERWFCTEEEAVAAGWRAPGGSGFAKTPNPTAAPDDFLGYEYHRFGCDIIGNVSMWNKGEHIYHCPNWPDYSKIKFDHLEGDRYFCSEEEAVAAGFRKPKNVFDPCIK